MRIDAVNNQNINITNNTVNEENHSIKAESLCDLFERNENGFMNNTVMDKKGVLNGLSDDGSLDSLKDEAQTLKDNLSAIFSKMDSGTVVQMDEDGIDVNDTEAHKIVSVVEQIQIKLAMFCDDFVPTMNIDINDIKNTVKNGGLAYSIANALSTVSQTEEVDNNTKAYLMKNELQPTVKNVYLASHAGYTQPKNSCVNDSEWEEMVPQVEKIIQDAGMEVSKENIDAGRWMLDNNIDVTPNNYKNYQMLNNLLDMNNAGVVFERVYATVLEGYDAADTLLTGEKLPWEEAETAIQTISEATSDNIMALSREDDENYTLDKLSDIVKNDIKMPADDKDYKYIKATRELQEIRLIMTINAGRNLEKTGVSINTVNISELVEKLRQSEAEYLNDNVSMYDISKVNNVIQNVDNLRFVPSAVIGSVMEAGENPAVNTFLYHAPAVQAKIDAAKDAYEALSTEVRSDLGDSVSKAVKMSMEDILSGLGYNDSEENRRAVRILAYNQMEFSEKNMIKVKSLDFSVNELFKKLNPENALRMIREGIDPLETSVEELNAYLNENGDSISKTAEKYSEFLYRMDRNHKISTEEREKYIGIYGLISKFEKDGMNSIGMLVKQGLELSMGNLLTAYMSGRDKGIDISLDSESGMSEVNDKVTYYKNLFGSIKNKINPDALMQMGPEFDNMEVEEFAREMESFYNDGSYMEYMNTMEEINNLEDNILKLVTENNIPATFNNLLAAKTIIKNPEKISDNLDDEIYDQFSDVIDNKEEMENVYDGLVEQQKEIVKEAICKEDSFINMDALRALANNLSFIGGLAKRNVFYIPYKNGNYKGIINLKVLEDSENSGSFTIKINKDETNITVQGKISKNNVHAQVMSDNRDKTENIKELVNNISEKLEENYDSVSIVVNTAKEQPEGTAGVNGVNTNEIFKVAKFFIQGLTN